MGAIGGKQAAAWWEVWPVREKEEMAAYEALGVIVTVEHRKDGQLILTADWPFEGQILKLEIRYSPLHPFFRPHVACHNVDLARHQHPLGKELCLLTQEARQWNSNQLVAYFLHERLPVVFGALKAREDGRMEEAAKLEENSPDPMMPYFTGMSEPGSIVYFNGDMPLPNGRAGLLDLTVVTRQDKSNPGAVEGIVHRVKSLTGDPLGMPLTIPGTAEAATTFKGVWVRMEPPRSTDVIATFEKVKSYLETEKTLYGKRVRRNIDEVLKSPTYFMGIAFPEEVAYGIQGAGWLFLMVRNLLDAENAGRARVHYVRGERIGENYLYARLPVAKSLRGKKVLLVGCGAIGSFVALELARAGVSTLTLVDGDVALPGNSLRWPLGRPVWGIGKAKALAEFIKANYPWTEVTFAETRLGMPASMETIGLKPNDLGKRTENLIAAMVGADIIIDTAASTEVQHALSHYSRQLGKPFIVANATMGAAGGIVARFRPESKACWVCLQERLQDGSIAGPQVDRSGAVTPVGCNEPTFTGGGFDIQEVSLEVVRSAVGILSGGAYKVGEWDIAVLNLQDPEGNRLLPEWKAHNLVPHPSCCGAVK